MPAKPKNPIFHFHAKIISRSFRARNGNRSSVAAAAYRAGEKLFDEQREQSYDFRKKTHAVYSEIISPIHSQPSQNWVFHRQALWNHIEKIENRRDAQLCREIEFALPLVLNQQENLELAREFITTQFVEKFSMLADMCIHWKEGNPHVHVMFPLRPLTAEGFGKKDSKKDVEQLKAWRKAWEEICNQHLGKAGYSELKVDCRSYKERGIDRKPEIHIGPCGKKATRKISELEKIKRRNRYVVPEGSELTRHSLFLNSMTRDASESKDFDVKSVNSGNLTAESIVLADLNSLQNQSNSIISEDITFQETTTLNYKNKNA